MRSRRYRLAFITIPLSGLLFWLAAGRYEDRQRQEHREVADQVVQALTLGALLYAQAHHDLLPPAKDWEHELRAYIGDVPVTLPPDGASPGRRFALNRAVAGRKLSALKSPAQVILFFESTVVTPSPSDDFQSSVPSDDPDPLVLGYADGHVEDQVPAQRRDELIALSRAALNSP